MADWFAFIITVGEEVVAWLGSMSIFGTTLAGVLVGFALIGFVIRTMVLRA